MEFDCAALPVRWLRPAPVRDPSPEASAARWRDMLLEAGFLVDLPPAVDDDDPRAWIAGVQQLLGELEAVEDELMRLQTRRHDVRWKGFRDLPWWLIVLMLVVPWTLGSLLFLFEEALGRHMVLIFALGLVPFFSLAVIKNLDRVRQTLRRGGRDRSLVAVRRHRGELRRALLEGVRATLDRSFVARGGPGLVARAADLEWLEQRLRDARRSGDPDRATALQAEHDAVEAAVRAALASPPDGWTAAGMETERVRWVDPSSPGSPPVASAAQPGRSGLR